MIDKSKSHKDFTAHKGEIRGEFDPPVGESSLNSTTSSAMRSGFLQRTFLGDGLREGVPEPSVYESDLLLTGKTHHIFAGPGTGKSWTALWLASEAVQRQEAVIYLDMENGQRTITERLQHLDVDPDVVDEYLYYVSYPSLDMGHEDKKHYANTLGSHGPGLLIFDSWVGFLGAANLDENSNTDVEAWSTSYINPAKRMGWTTVLLDHVPHNAARSRGASRKKDLVDVQWRLDNPKPFDREHVGGIQLIREKDREGFLPESVAFSVGGTPEGFVFERSEVSASTTTREMADSARVLLETLEGAFGDAGARPTELMRVIPWKGELGMNESTFRHARNWLSKNKPGLLVKHKDGKLYSKRNSATTATAVTAPGQ